MSGHTNWNDIRRGRPRKVPVPSAEVLHDMLLLTGANIGLSVIESWTDEQRQLAGKWAALEHLSASDNPVRRIPCPEFVEAARGCGDA